MERLSFLFRTTVQPTWFSVLILTALVEMAHAEPSFIQEVARCWNIPAGAEPVRVSVLVKLARDGSVLGKPQVLNVAPDGLSARAAVRAILRCAPYGTVPAHPERYEDLKEVIVHFDPEDAQRRGIP